MKTVATRASKVITLTKQNVKLHETHQSKVDEIQCKERGLLIPEQVEVETELDCSVLEEQLYSPSLSRLWRSGVCILHYEAKEELMYI